MTRSSSLTTKTTNCEHSPATQLTKIACHLAHFLTTPVSVPNGAGTVSVSVFCFQTVTFCHKLKPVSVTNSGVFLSPLPLCHRLKVPVASQSLRLLPITQVFRFGELV